MVGNRVQICHFSAIFSVLTDYHGNLHNILKQNQNKLILKKNLFRAYSKTIQADNQ